MKKTISVFLALILVFSLAACGSQNTAGQEQTPEPSAAVTETQSPVEENAGETAEEATVTITDVHGRVVTVPKNPEKVVISALQTFSFAIVGALDSVVADQNCSGYVNSFPQLADKDIAWINDDDTVNIELLLELDPDIVFYRTIDGNDENVKTMEEAGLNVVCELGLTYEQQITCIEFIGEIYGDEAVTRANAFADYYRNVYDTIGAKYADIPEEDKPSVIAMWSRGYVGNYRPAADGNVNADFFELCGGKNAYTGDTTIDAEIEQILEWNPDYIFILGSKDILDMNLEDEAFMRLTAAQNGNVYVTPIGIGSWSTPTPENALTLQWMASILHPEDYADVNVAEVVQDFYSTFYGIEESIDMINLRLQGINPYA